MRYAPDERFPNITVSGKKRASHPEDTLHEQIVTALKVLLPQPEAPASMAAARAYQPANDEVIWYSTENRHNGAREGARRKRRGCFAGVADMHFYRRGVALKIELKSEGNKMTPGQVLMSRRLEVTGIRCYVCRSLEEVIQVLRENGFPLRGAI